MRIRRPLVALLTALTLFGGGATLTACGDPAGLDRRDGTSDDDTGNTDSGNVEDNNGGGDAEGDDDQSNQEQGDEDDGDDQSDPD